MKKWYSLNNISLEDKSYEINKYIMLKQDNDNHKKTWVYINETQPDYEGDPTLFFYTLLLAIPKVHIDIGAREREKSETAEDYYHYKTYEILYLGSIMFNYYFDADGSFDNSHATISEKDIDKIKNIHNIVVEFNKKRNKDNTSIDNWMIAYNKYLAAYKSLSIEVSIQNMITVLEALLLEGSGELSFRVALYTSLIIETDLEKRKEVSALIKYMYDIRSKSVHGDIKSAKSKLKTLDYNKYYRFKEIVSEVLIKTYGKSEKDLALALDRMIYSAGDFEDYIKNK